MRRLLALGCCAVHLVFGFAASLAHVHESADHHEQARGLHLDHAHPVQSARHGHDGHHGHGSAEHGVARSDDRHVEHHEGDALSLTATALRSFDPSQRGLPAIVAIGATIDPPRAGSERDVAIPEQLRGPPREQPAQPRAPPA